MLHGGTPERIRGAQAPGGVVLLRWTDTGEEVVAANAGDYVYPSDVRVNVASGLLYVKTSGLAGGISRQTWLFEYDLRRHHMTHGVRVDDANLPTECAAPAQATQGH